MPGLTRLTQPRATLLGVYSELTYAQAYLKEAFFPRPVRPPPFFPGALHVPHLPGIHRGCGDVEGTDIDILSVHKAGLHSYTFFSNAAIPIGVPVQYWEVTLIERSLDRSRTKITLSIGYVTRPMTPDPAHPDKMLWEIAEYCNNGDVRLYGLNQFPCASGTSFDFGDVVGCGYIHPTTFFFTKNGELTASVQGEHPKQIFGPAVKFSSLDQNGNDDEAVISLEANFGHTGFRFDILTHLNSLYSQTPLRRLAASIPPEMLDYILEHTLQVVDEGLPNAEELRNLQRLAQVSRRWRILCLQHRYTTFEISSTFDLNYASSVHPWFHYRKLKIQEQPTMPWIHRLFATPLLHQLYLPPQGILEGLDADFPERVTPRVYLTIPAVLRNTFVHLQMLELRHCAFSSWLSFVKFVFAFPALNELVLGPSFSCHVNGPVPVFPRWLRFTQRPLHVAYPGGKFLDHLLWLFISGQQRNTARNTERWAAMPERDLTLSQHDANIMFSVLKIVSEMCPRAYSIHYDAKSDTECTLSYLNSPTMCFSFSFRKHHQLYVPVLIELSCPLNTGGTHFREINTLLGQLSNPADCRCRLDFTPEIESREGNRQVVITLQQNILVAMHQRYYTGLINFVYDGEELPHPGPNPVEFMSKSSPSFGLLFKDHVLQAGDVTTITWDVDCVNSNTPVIPWIKLFAVANAPEYGKYAADLAHMIDARMGKADLSIPASIEPGFYFLAIGCYNYRTETFVIVKKYLT